MRALVFLTSGLLAFALAENKYSREANEPASKNKVRATLQGGDDAPFRMAKINQIWTKARKVNRHLMSIP